jgi:cation diffusion facilitator CzcD-associated flavoprotein CzcO
LGLPYLPVVGRPLDFDLLECNLTADTVDIAIIGAGPYGLSLAAQLRGGGHRVRIFGSPMHSWSNHMPRGMHLKSEGFASNLYDPEAKFTLQTFCAERSIAYADIGLPVAIETFIAYGQEFQRRYVPELENVQITSLKQTGGRFELTTAAGENVLALQVVIASGIVNFAYLPPQLAAISGSMLSHSSEHSDLTGFKGRRVAVLGAGASALDIAALLLEAGADVELVARTPTVQFQNPPDEPRPLLRRMTAPRSGLGIGWRSRMCTDIPLVFHAMPERLRLRAVERHLGPAPCWFTREAVANRLPMHLGVSLGGASAREGRVHLVLRKSGQPDRELAVDHVIAATGYKAAVSRLTFIDESVRSRVLKTGDAPALSRHFESSVPGLYFVGAAAANSFGPLLRFAYGARFAAKRVAARLTTR